MSYKHSWLKHVNRVVDIKKAGKTIYERALIKDVDIRNLTFFILTQEGKEITLIKGHDMVIESYPEETLFKVNGKVVAL